MDCSINIVIDWKSVAAIGGTIVGVYAISRMDPNMTAQVMNGLINTCNNYIVYRKTF